MRMKKTRKALLALTATVAISTAFTAPASAANVTVKSGDTLYGIAKANNTSVSSLQSLNNISGSLIFPGQVLKTTSSTSSTTTTSTSSAKTYKVVSGDTLSKIGRAYSVSVSNLKTWNNLSSDLIRVGQTLKVSGSAVKSVTTTSQVKAATTTKSSSSLVNIAKQYTGVPYVWGGNTPSGFDCSGFIYYSLNKAGINVSRTTAAGYYNMTTKVSSPQPGDLVFFSGTYKAGISHMGIYIGNGKMIQAGSSTGVTTSSIHTGYWSKYFTGYGRM